MPQHFKKAADFAWIVAGPRCILHAQAVGFPFVVSTESQKENADRVSSNITELSEGWRKRAADSQTNWGEPCTRQLANGMPSCNVTDFMPHHGGELGFVMDVGQNAASQVDVSARDREGVHYRRIHNGKMPFQIRTVRHGDEFSSERLDVRLGYGMVRKTVLGANLLITLLPHGNLLTLRHENDLAFSSHRIAGAGRECCDGHQNNKQFSPLHLHLLF